jgi:hypothetical protein
MKKQMTIQRAREILGSVFYPSYTFNATVDGRGEMYLQGEYLEPDIYTGKLEVQNTRRWFISPEMTKSELVQTAFKLIMTSMEHRVREHFQYNGRLVFGPHFNVDNLWEIANQIELRQP